MKEYDMGKDVAMQIIESCAGFDDPSTSVGEAWQVILKEMQDMEEKLTSCQNARQN